jgi:hypothetical protein
LSRFVRVVRDTPYNAAARVRLNDAFNFKALIARMILSSYKSKSIPLGRGVVGGGRVGCGFGSTGPLNDADRSMINHIIAVL